ncbi:MFS general substrate transporter [Auricularia subglabra TFB-10046 SS5]|nr:MFS general substrate transporter [Auricularia subglabra TFB-10046 SS5]
MAKEGILDGDSASAKELSDAAVTVADGSDDLELAAQSPQEAAYSVWTKHEKLAIIALPAVASMLSTMSVQIYFPAIPLLADSFHVSIEAINLTVTSFLVMQGLSPMIFGPLADLKGRRLAFISCITILCGSCIGMAVMPQDAYWLLVFLRCIQSAGSASTISISFGVITDIATPAERGTLVGVGALPAVRPIIGGALADHFGWRGIFWFLAAFSAAVNVAIILILPETLRTVVGDGSIAPPLYLRPLVPLLTRYDSTAKRPSGITTKSGADVMRALVPRFLGQPDMLAILASNACSFALFQAVSATISPVLLEDYPFLTQTTIGLCFFPIGFGAALGSALTGRVLDREFRRFGGTRGERIAPEFPLEKARLRLIPLYTALIATSVMVFGWTTGRTSLAAPLVFTFITGWSVTGLMNSHQTICMDLAPGQGASVTAANNLFRCLLGAAVVAAVDALRRRLGTGWLFVLLSGTCALLVAPLITFVRLRGPKLRARRSERKEEDEDKART